VRDIRTMQAALGRSVRGWQRRLVMFYDNNIAGHLGYLRALCDALEPLGIEWASCLTFNVLTNRPLLQRMFASGCRAVFVGLETFNPRALADFNKPQNKLAQVREAIAQARDEGILVTAGLILSPVHDDPGYIRALPQYLSDSGLHVPTFLCFETPIPGTPFFERLARAEVPRLMPNALLRDFNAYTLTVQPSACSAEAFVAAYRDTLRALYAPRRRLAKLADDLPRLLKRRSWTAAALDLGDQWMGGPPQVPGRSHIAGSEPEPPERVPFEPDDFRGEAERWRVCAPTVVTDGLGRVLPAWQRAQAGQPVPLPLRTTTIASHA
jgi:hypothetical protein